MAESLDVPSDVLEAVQGACLALPEAYEEDAWVGVRWMVRKRTFAHVLMVGSGRPPAYARAAAHDGPVCVLTFESSGPELARLRSLATPWFAPPWRRTIVGLLVSDATDWDEVRELLVESYCVQAPKKLAAAVRERPSLDG